MGRGNISAGHSSDVGADEAPLTEARMGGGVLADTRICSDCAGRDAPLTGGVWGGVWVLSLAVCLLLGVCGVDWLLLF